MCTLMSTTGITNWSIYSNMAWMTWRGYFAMIWLTMSLRTHAISSTPISATMENLSTHTLSPRGNTSNDGRAGVYFSGSTSSDFLVSQESTSGIPDANRQKIPLYIGGFFSLGGLWDGSGVLPAVEMGLDHVNNRTDILEEYELKMIWNDTQCQSSIANRMFIDQLLHEPTQIILLGPPCSTSAQVIAKSAHFLNLITLSYAAESLALSNKDIYPHFYRTVALGSSSNFAIIRFMQHIGWSRLATIQQTEAFALSVEDLGSKLKGSNLTLVTSETISTNPYIPVANIKKRDAKIIYMFIYEDKARKILCEARRQGMATAEYVWIMPGWYTQQWWTEDNNAINCTVDEMNDAVNSTTILTTHQLHPGPKDGRTISEFTPKQLESELRDRFTWPQNQNYTMTDYGPNGYDAIWAIALMLNKSAQVLAEKVFEDGKKRRLEDFHYEDSELFLETFVYNLDQTDFDGMTGHVTFRDGDRLADTSIGQMQEYAQVTVATYFIKQDSLLLENNIIWKGGYVPLDHTRILRLEHYHGISYPSYIAMCLFAGIGILLAGIFLVFNIRYREKRLLKRSSPNINNLVIIGNILIYISVPIAGLDHVSLDTLQAACQARIWFLSIGFVLAFGSMFSKIWRVYRVAALKTPVRRVITDGYLFIMIFVFLCIDVFLLTLWQAIEPMHLEPKNLTVKESDLINQHVVNIHYIQQCTSDNLIYWLLPLYTYKGLLLIFGTFLVWETRKVTIPALNDSKLIGICVYNTIVLCIVGVSVSFLISDNTSWLFIFTSGIIIFCATFSQLVLFIPKVMLLRKYPDGLTSTSISTLVTQGNGRRKSSLGDTWNGQIYGKNPPAEVENKYGHDRENGNDTLNDCVKNGHDNRKNILAGVENSSVNGKDIIAVFVGESNNKGNLEDGQNLENIVDEMENKDSIKDDTATTATVVVYNVDDDVFDEYDTKF
ncbi:gamma-aminobutyric acid type B receptor subunit 1-like [Amphiura filiformis]|uniref:gamma-aminobutyric acid type B receptor subunit 1-like n=1 Tax=Amphiura filiformis TaxID=82378 RepID=UPI003B21AAD4